MNELSRATLSSQSERAILVGVILTHGQGRHEDKLPDIPGLPKSPAKSRRYASAYADWEDRNKGYEGLTPEEELVMAGEDPLAELASLASTAGAQVVARLVQRRPKVDAATYMGKGKVIELAQLAQAMDANVVLFDNDLSPSQIGELETLINKHCKRPPGKGVKVLDRSELILDIFATRARTYEAKLQVELAQMQYTYPRLTKMWDHLERLAGGSGSQGIGTRGPGETQLEIDRRLVRKRISVLRDEISKVQARKEREVDHRRSRHFTVGIVGYTNAGKSTLFNTLTAAGVYADDKLFATLDTRTRKWVLERGLEVMLSDTVGFVRDLPHHLVASFKATLSEAAGADLLLHVLDVSHPQAREQYAEVNKVLKEVGVIGREPELPEAGLADWIEDRHESPDGQGDGIASYDDGQPPEANIARARVAPAPPKPIILCLNKTDTPSGEENGAYWRAIDPSAVLVSAKTGAGLVDLAARVAEVVAGSRKRMRVQFSLGDGKLLARLESMGVVENREVLNEPDEPQVVITAWLGDGLAAELAAVDGLSMQAAQS